jgi:hypothetical protein
VRTFPMSHIPSVTGSLMRSDRSSRYRLVLVSTGLLLVVLIAVGVYGLLTGPPATPSPSLSSVTGTDTGISSRPAAAPSSPASTAVPPGDGLSALPHTDDPVVYARAVAATLLAWDTMSTLAPDDHARHVLDDADPAGRETPGLAADVTNYLPTLEVWQQLRDHATAQSVTIVAASIPDSWDDIAASPSAEHLRPGTVAVTIEATRHRTGTWFDEPAEADHPVTFTVFLACPPAFDRCHTLRLSRPDDPLP